MDKRFAHPDPHEQLERRRQLLKSLQDNPGQPVAQVIALLRKELRMTLAEFSVLTSVSPRIIHAIEHGKGNPTLGTVEKLLAPFGLSLGVVARRRG